MNGGGAMLIVVLLPFAAALLVALFGKRPNLRDGTSLLFAVATVIATIFAVGPTLQGAAGPEITLWEMLPGISLRFSLEPLGLLFALVASGLWVLTTIYSIGYMRGHHETNQTRFFACFAIAIGASLGVAFAGNLLTLFVFYEVLTLSTYPLVTHHRTAEAKRAGRVYLGILLGTSIVFFLFAIIWTWVLTGTTEFTAGGILAGKVAPAAVPWLLALFMFGIGKAALMPFHRWLPAAMVAPTPVSALLHAVAVVKVGVFTVLKVITYIFGIDLLRNTGANEWLIAVAGATILLASLIALKQQNLKARLAYSTISQLSYIVLGAALAHEMGLIGGGMHIAMHAVGKITLFFCAGAIYVTAHKTEIPDMVGIGRKMPITMGAFFLGAISIIGLPPGGGAWSKWFLGLAAARTDHQLMVAVLMISSLLNIAYLMPIVARAFFLPPADKDQKPGIQEAPLLCLIPLCITAVGGVALFFFADELYRLLAPIAG